MKKHNLKLLSILVISPLLMANSPAPRPSTDRYDDIEVSIVYNNKKSPDGTIFDHTLTLRNTGDKYIAANYYLYATDKNNKSYSLLLPDEGHIFVSYAIGPGEKDVCKYYPNEIVDNTTFKSFSTECYSLVDEEVTFQGSGNVTKVDTPVGSGGGLTYQIDVEVLNLGDYHYDIVLDVTYLGEEYSVILMTNNTIRTNEALDLSQFKVNGYHAFRNDRSTYNNAWSVLYIIGQVFFWCFILAVVLGIAAAIAVPVSIHAHRRKRLKRELENKE